MKLKTLFCAAILALVSAACSIQQQGGHTEAEFKEPFTVSPWESENRTTADGQKACTITSNSITFVVRKGSGGNVVSVQTSRFMPVGTDMTVTVNGHRYSTMNRYFSSKDAVAMADDFSAGGTAYAEWSELKAFNGRERYNTEYNLRGFKQKFDACQR